eukprot:TRINITY_DN6348_c0_g1_i1.p1 TRINITY_DN6348_c0_g1~~TRINITY_DN6348_c0_g1_i1.p1  ORF type:complete len:621 (-),score=47.95 TRINITY_DN6348_c0_g1_i1:417-2279(-)
MTSNAVKSTKVVVLPMDDKTVVKAISSYVSPALMKGNFLFVEYDMLFPPVPIKPNSPVTVSSEPALFANFPNLDDNTARALGVVKPKIVEKQQLMTPSEIIVKHRSVIEVHLTTSALTTSLLQIFDKKLFIVDAGPNTVAKIVERAIGYCSSFCFIDPILSMMLDEFAKAMAVVSSSDRLEAIPSVAKSIAAVNTEFAFTAVNDFLTSKVVIPEPTPIAPKVVVKSVIVLDKDKCPMTVAEMKSIPKPLCSKCLAIRHYKCDDCAYLAKMVDDESFFDDGIVKLDPGYFSRYLDFFHFLGNVKADCDDPDVVAIGIAASLAAKFNYAPTTKLSKSSIEVAEASSFVLSKSPIGKYTNNALIPIVLCAIKKRKTPDISDDALKKIYLTIVACKPDDFDIGLLSSAVDLIKDFSATIDSFNMKSFLKAVRYTHCFAVALACYFSTVLTFEAAKAVELIKVVKTAKEKLETVVVPNTPAKVPVIAPVVTNVIKRVLSYIERIVEKDLHSLATDIDFAAVRTSQHIADLYGTHRSNLEFMFSYTKDLDDIGGNLPTLSDVDVSVGLDQLSKFVEYVRAISDTSSSEAFATGNLATMTTKGIFAWLIDVSVAFEASKIVGERVKS